MIADSQHAYGRSRSRTWSIGDEEVRLAEVHVDGWRVLSSTGGEARWSSPFGGHAAEDAVQWLSSDDTVTRLRGVHLLEALAVVGEAPRPQGIEVLLRDDSEAVRIQVARLAFSARWAALAGPIEERAAQEEDPTVAKILLHWMPRQI